MSSIWKVLWAPMSKDSATSQLLSIPSWLCDLGASSTCLSLPVPAKEHVCLRAIEKVKRNKLRTQLAIVVKHGYRLCGSLEFTFSNPHPSVFGSGVGALGK